jgi:hypothetical protein
MLVEQGHARGTLEHCCSSAGPDWGSIRATVEEEESFGTPTSVTALATPKSPIDRISAICVQKPLHCSLSSETLNCHRGHSACLE